MSSNPPKRRVRKAVASVTAENTEKGLVVDSKTKSVVVPDISYTCDNPAMVSVSGKVTKNLGNYESLSVSVGISLPCNPNDKEIDKAYDYASSFVDKYTIKELQSCGVEVQEEEDN